MAYETLEPFDAQRGDIRAAVVASTMANIHRGKNKKAYKLTDFIVRFDADDGQSPDQMLKIVEMINKALGGKDLRGNRGNDRDAST